MADSEFLKSVGIASEEGYNRMEVSYANVEFLNLTIESLLRDQRALEQMAAKANRRFAMAVNWLIMAGLVISTLTLMLLGAPGGWLERHTPQNGELRIVRRSR